MKILITGDLVVSNEYDPTRLFDKEVISMFRSSDYNIVNLEASVTSSQSKINKTGPHLFSLKKCLISVLMLQESINLICMIKCI